MTGCIRHHSNQRVLVGLAKRSFRTMTRLAVHMLLGSLGDTPEPVPAAATLSALRPSRNTQSLWETALPELIRTAASTRKIGAPAVPGLGYFICPLNSVSTFMDSAYRTSKELVSCISSSMKLRNVQPLEWRINKQVMHEYGPLLRGTLFLAIGSAQAHPGRIRISPASAGSLSRERRSRLYRSDGGSVRTGSDFPGRHPQRMATDGYYRIAEVFTNGINCARRVAASIAAVLALGMIASLSPDWIASAQVLRPEFDVASIKQHTGQTNEFTFAAQAGGRLNVVDNEISNVIDNAYGISYYQLDRRSGLGQFGAL